MEQKLFSIEELSPILKLHPKTILRFIHEGKIRAGKIGRSWMVTEADLKNYVHGELADIPAGRKQTVDYSHVSEDISVSAVVEIKEQNSEEASRISNSLMALLNGRDDSMGPARFDFFYYPEARKAKYVLYGSPRFIAGIMKVFDVLCQQRGSVNEIHSV